MLDILTKTTLQGKGRLLPHWCRMLDQVRTHIDIRLGWFDLSNPKASGAVRWITNLLFKVETDYLLSREDDTDRYFSVIDFLDNLSREVDFVHRQLPKKGIFYSQGMGQQPTSEIVLPIAYQQFSDTPMDLHIDAWADAGAEPVTVLYDPCFELVEDMRSGQIARMHQPPMVILGMNIPLLIFMWISYVKENPYEHKMNPEPFVYHHVLRPMMYQSANHWVVSLINALLSLNVDTESIVKQFSSTKWMPQRVLAQACEELRTEVMRLSYSQIDVGDILNSQLLFSGTLNEHINNYTIKCDVPDMRQYRAIEFLYEAPYIKMLLYMFFLDERSSKSKLIKQRLAIAMREFARMNISTMIRDKRILDIFNQDVIDITALLDT